MPLGTLVRAGDTVLVDQHNPAMTDIAQALTNSMARTGVGGMLADLPMGGHRVTGLAAAVDANDAVTLAQLNASSGGGGGGASPAYGVSVFDFIPKSKQADITAGINTENLTSYFQEAAAAAYAVGATSIDGARGTVRVPIGTYHVDKVGMRQIVFIGESREGTLIRAFSPGGAGDFMFDSMLERDGTTFNTYGNGWCENMMIDGRMANGQPSGRSGLRVYGGGCHPTQLRMRFLATGLAVGLSLWSSVQSVYASECNTGIYTFHNTPGDSGTSTTFLNCWADLCTTYGFHISQLYYSQFVGCIAQNCGTYDFFVDGNLNGNPACYSLMFIGCGTESSAGNNAIPFYIKKARQVSIFNPRVIGAPTTDFVVFDDSTGSLHDFATQAAPGSGKYHLNVINHTGGNGSISLLGDGNLQIPASAFPLVSELGATVNGVRRLAVGGTFVGGFVSTPGMLPASSNDYAVPLNASAVRLSPASGGSSITGIAMAPGGGGFDNQRLLVHNASGADNVTLVNASVGSASGNRFNFPGGDLVLSPLESVELWYDAIQQRWHFVR